MTNSSKTIFRKIFRVTNRDFASFTHQSSNFDQVLSVLGTLDSKLSNIRNRFPRNDPSSQIQKHLDIQPIVYRFVLDQFSFVKNPGTSQTMKLFHSLQCFLQIFSLFQALQSV